MGFSPTKKDKNLGAQKNLGSGSQTTKLNHELPNLKI